ncbi:hypothetical protein GCM10009575_097580 [Streptomyces rhizosphaericus]|uniref:Uncharacterized protein n=1 Tax=Streptomyces rhizosphaericus TaxID=114699 RepID=A0ABN1RRX4_9ACTN
MVGKPEDGWDIDTSGVRGVLLKTGRVADDIEGQAKSYGKHLLSAAKSAGTLSMGCGPKPEGGPVAAALVEFEQKTENDIKYIAARSGKSIKGAATATKEYVGGDLAMAAHAQHEALKAPDLNPPGKHHRAGPK